MKKLFGLLVAFFAVAALASCSMGGGHKHTYEKHEAKAPTCEASGTIEYYSCSGCSDLFSDENGTKITADKIVVPALGHNYGDWTVTTAPTCTEDGEETRVCANDESHKETRPVDALGHAWGEWVETLAPTCTEAGLRTRTCTVCEATDEEPIPAAGHTMEHVEAKEVTLDESGNFEYWFCSVCEKYFKDENGTEEFEENGWLIPVHEHVFELVEATDSTCVTVGYEEHFACTICGKAASFEDEVYTIVDLDTFAKPLSSHTFELVEAVASTCTTPGNAEYYTCTVCNGKFNLELDPETGDVVSFEETDPTLELDPDNHELEFVAGIAPTYDADGMRDYYVCKYHGDAMFYDEEGTNPVLDEADLIAPMLVVDEDLVADAISYTLADFADDWALVEAEEANFGSELYGQLETAYLAGQNLIKGSKTVSEVSANYKQAKQDILALVPSATGIYNYSNLSKAERTILTGVVERFVVNTGLTGLTLYESGSYVLYNPRIVLGTDTYIPSYGFGILPEGNITAPLDSETNEAWKMYYHTFETSDPGTANYWNDQGAQVGDIFGFFSGSLFETFMADTKDSYKWVGSLSKYDRPQGKVVDPETGDVIWTEDTVGTRWRVEINTGLDGLKYNTLSQLENRAAFNNRLVAAEDYLTPYRVMLTQSNNLFRGGEAANATGTKIKGIKEYYDATKEYAAGDGQNPLYDVNAWNQYVKPYLDVYEEDGKWYFEWENTEATNAFDAMYYIAGSLYSPLPEDFINLVGVEFMFGYNTDKTASPVDNSLSLGAYTLEAWTNKEIVFKKNPNYIFADTKYQIQGVYETFLDIASDEDLAVKEFLAGHLDAASLTQNYLSEYKNDPRSHRAVSGSNFKINANTANQATWEYYFGENGIVSKTSKENYWDLKPCMSNKYFYRALSYSLNRSLVADAHGSVPSFAYLGSVYMADAENGLSYNLTKAHEDAIEPFIRDTDGFGYSRQLAIEYFRLALTQLEEEGAYIRGTKENPTIIEIEIAWMYPYQETSYHAEVKQMLEEVFNDDAVSGGCYKLNVVFWAGPVWSDVYYNKLMKGQFDLGFGSISGNTYNILDYMSVLSADQKISGGFTLNWGPQTDSDTFDFLFYDGVKWSFDNLIQAANGTIILNDGVISPAYEYNDENLDATVNENGSWTFTSTFKSNIADATFELSDLVPFGYLNGEAANTAYFERSALESADIDLTYNEETQVWTFTVTLDAATVEEFTKTYYLYSMPAGSVLCLDLYVTFANDQYTFLDGGYFTSIYLLPLVEDEPAE